MVPLQKGELMFSRQLKFQKILSYALIVMFALLFLYSLSVITHVYVTLFSAFDPELEHPEWGSSGEKVKGAKLFYDMQPFNKQLLTVAIIVIIVSLTYFLTGSKNRRKYYISNYVSAGIIAVTFVFAAIFTVVNVAKYRVAFLQVDFEALKTYNEPLGLPYSNSTFWFDLGFVISALLIIVAGLTVFNSIWKTTLMKKENALLSGEGGIQ